MRDNFGANGKIREVHGDPDHCTEPRAGCVSPCGYSQTKGDPIVYRILCAQHGLQLSSVQAVGIGNAAEDLAAYTQPGTEVKECLFGSCTKCEFSSWL